MKLEVRLNKEKSRIMLYSWKFIIAQLSSWKFIIAQLSS